MNRDDVIEKIQNTAMKTLPKGTTVLLFGSRVRGDATRDSDWDILILLDKDKISNEDYDQYAYPMTSLGWDINETVSPILYTKNQWSSYSFTPFYKSVQQFSMPIYES